MDGNIFTIYEAVGHKVPFTAQAHPHSSYSDYYCSQWVEVTRVIPNHKGYGKAYGYFHVDKNLYPYDINEAHISTEEEEIDGAGIYKWDLLEVSANAVEGGDGVPVVVLTENDVVPFGKLKGKTIKEALQESPNYIYGYLNGCLLHGKYYKVEGIDKKDTRRTRVINLDEEIPFGKYRGTLMRKIIEKDPGYIDWMVNNTPYTVGI